jgi:NAD(P)-dependent dehydrogenase (short-subunit alcohol dehydrogenase family)
MEEPMQRVLITGANRGVGLELVRQCLLRGDRVFAACRNPSAAAALHALASQHPGRLSLHTMDVTDEESIANASCQVQAETLALDMLINNAAILPGHETIRDVTSARLVSVNQVNAVGTLLVVQCFLDLLLKGESPRIIQISSEAGSISSLNHLRYYSYGGSKALLNYYTRALAFDPNLKNVIVAAVHPGWVRTDMGGLDADLSAEESARGILQVAASLTPADSGKFLNWRGKELSW